MLMRASDMAAARSATSSASAGVVYMPRSTLRRSRLERQRVRISRSCSSVTARRRALAGSLVRGSKQSRLGVAPPAPRWLRMMTSRLRRMLAVSFHQSPSASASAPGDEATSGASPGPPER